MDGSDDSDEDGSLEVNEPSFMVSNGCVPTFTCVSPSSWLGVSVVKSGCVSFLARSVCVPSFMVWSRYVHDEEWVCPPW